MQITIDTHTATPAEARALMRLLLGEVAPGINESFAPTVTTVDTFDAQKCREVYENTYHKVAADIPFDVWEFVWKSAHGVWAGGPVKFAPPAAVNLDAVPLSKLLNFFNRHRGALSTDELNTLIADSNDELYSRRVIKPDDNPAAGVELPAAAVAGMDDTINAGDDLASIFGAAATDPDAHPSHPEITGTPEPKITDMVITMLDKNGLPWDSRIHAASKAINADGTWRQKRGVAPELVATVEAQLRGVMAVPVPDAPPAAQDDIQDHDPNEVLGGEGPKVVPPPPTVVTPPAPPPVLSRINDAAPFGEPTTFPELVQFVTAQKLAGKLTQAQLDAALQIIGVQGALPVMAARPDLIPTLVAKLRVLAGA